MLRLNKPVTPELEGREKLLKEYDAFVLRNTE